MLTEAMLLLPVLNILKNVTLCFWVYGFKRETETKYILRIILSWIDFFSDWLWTLLRIIFCKSVGVACSVRLNLWILPSIHWDIFLSFFIFKLLVLSLILCFLIFRSEFCSWNRCTLINSYDHVCGPLKKMKGQWIDVFFMYLNAINFPNL